jgi:hypothetical protein
LIVTGGFATPADDVALSDTGGGILNGGVLTLTDSRVSRNTAELDGGGIETFGSVRLSSSVVEFNAAGRFGGGINNFVAAIGAGDLTIADSVVTGNTAGLDGGGVENSATAAIRGSTINGNSAGRFGGGIANSGATTRLELTNSVIRDNTAESASGIENFNNATCTADSVSVTANLGGLAGVRNQTGSVFRVGRSVLAQNANSDCRGTFRSEGSNVVGNARDCRGFENDQVANPPLPPQPPGFAPQIANLSCEQVTVSNAGGTGGRFRVTAVFTLPGGDRFPVTAGSGALGPLEEAVVIFTSRQGAVPPADCLFAPLNDCELTVDLFNPTDHVTTQGQACGGR